MRLILNNSAEVDDEFYGVFYKPHMNNEANWMKLAPYISGIVDECWDEEGEATTRAELVSLFATPFARIVHKNKVPKVIDFMLNRLNKVDESCGSRNVSSDSSSSDDDESRPMSDLQRRMAQRMQGYKKVLL